MGRDMTLALLGDLTWFWGHPWGTLAALLVLGGVVALIRWYDARHPVIRHR